MVPVEIWVGLVLGDDDLRALHAALHPTLTLCALAGWQPDAVLFFHPDSNDVLELAFDPRVATVIDQGLLDVTALGTPPGNVAMVISVPVRSGLIADALPWPDDVQVVQSGPYLSIDLGVSAVTVSTLVTAVEQQQGGLVAWLSSNIASHNAAAGPTLTGLVSLLDPALWDFPDAVSEGSGPTAEALRDLARPIADAALASDGALSGFLLEEAMARTIEDQQLPSVHDRLSGRLADTLVPVVPAIPVDDVNRLARAWRRESDHIYDLLGADAAAPFRNRDHRKLTYLELVLDAVNYGLFSTVSFDLTESEPGYGGFDLRHTWTANRPAGAPVSDVDPDPGKRVEQTYVYGGTEYTATFASAAVTPGHVMELRDDLEAIGFGPLADTDHLTNMSEGNVEEKEKSARRRVYGPWLEAAVREFQFYASQPRVARKPLPTETQPGADNHSLGSTLIGVDNDRLYDGPISGVLNADTRQLLKMWVERDWHCPVVVENRALTSGDLTALRAAGPGVSRSAIVRRRAVIDSSVWRPRQRKSESFIVWDYTDVAPIEPYRAGEPMVLSGYVPPPAWLGNWGGPGAGGSNPTSAYIYPSAEIVPSSVVATVPDRIDGSKFWSTFRVVRAVSEVESIGYFDGLNAWDTAITSGGMIHWTLGLMKTAAGNNPNDFFDNAVLYPGELGGFLAYFHAVDPAEFDRWFGRYGVRPTDDWEGADGLHLVTGHRKYTGWLSFQQDDGTWVDLRHPQAAGLPVASAEDAVLAEMLKSWHWTHRVLLASRTASAMWPLMWDFTRARVRELLSTPWRVGGAVLQITEVLIDGTAISRDAEIGDIVTSERGVALMVRQHVFNPVGIFGLNDRTVQWGGATLDNVNLAALQPLIDHVVCESGKADPADWGDAEEAMLVAGLFDGVRKRNPDCSLAKGNATFLAAGQNFERVRDWPIWSPNANVSKYDTSLLTAASHSPVITPLANLSMWAGERLDVRIDARSATGVGPLAFDLQLDELPAGMFVTERTDESGVFEITTETDTPHGRWVATVTVTDGPYSASISFDVDVGDPGEPASDAEYDLVLHGDLDLDIRRHSFSLDAGPTDPFSAPTR